MQMNTCTKGLAPGHRTLGTGCSGYPFGHWIVWGNYVGVGLTRSAKRFSLPVKESSE